MIPPDVANLLALYYVIGLLWLTSSLLPKPFGWLRHDMPLVFQILFVVFFGAIWPLVAAKVFYSFIRGDKEFRL